MAAALGACVGSVAASATSWTACQACSCIACCCCSSLCGTPSKEVIVSRTSRISYFVLFVVAVVCAGVFRSVQAPETCVAATDIFCKNLRCPVRQEDGSELPFDPTCMARAFVLRIAFATSVFHLFLALFTIGADDYSNPRIAIHTAMWPVKMLVWTVMHAAVFFMPASFFLGFGWLALVLGILFLFVQIIYYIEICFATNEDLLEGRGPVYAAIGWACCCLPPHPAQGEGRSTEEFTLHRGHGVILFISVCGFGAAIAQTVVMFLYFTSSASGGCQLYQFFASFSLIQWLFLTLFSFLATAWMPEAGLLPSAAVAPFISFKTLSALYSQARCNKLLGDQGNTGPPELIAWIAIMVAVFLAGYASMTISANWKEVFSLSGESTARAGSQNAAGSDGVAPGQLHLDVEGEGGGGSEPRLAGHIGYSVAGFHVMIAFASCYVAMQMTNWNQEFSKAEMDTGMASMWIKAVDSWILAIGYGWALIAPKVLTNRDFS